jgi:hypothetical protein
MKNVVYTFLVGAYDTLKEPEVVTPGWDYICFTDNTELTSDTWRLRPVPEWCWRRANPKKTASLIKIEHYSVLDSSYDTVITMDASMTITGCLDEFVAGLGFDGYDFMALEHEQRNCVYEEAQDVLQLRYEYADVVTTQMERYREEGYPKNNGVWLSGLTVRRNGSSSLRKACQIWSHEYDNGARRDQLSLNYAFWKSASLGYPVQFKELPGYQRDAVLPAGSDRGSVRHTFQTSPHRKSHWKVDKVTA